MNHQRRLLIVLLLAVMFMAIVATVVAATAVAASQNHQNASIDLSWNVIGASGGHAFSASYRMETTLGQPIVDLSSGATTHLSAGFWQTEGTGYRVFLPIVLK